MVLLGIHLVGIPQWIDHILPDTSKAGCIYDGLADHLQAQVHLPGRGAGFAVELQGVFREVTHHEVEDLIDGVIIHFVEPGVLEDQLPVDHQREEFAERQQEIGVLLLGFVRGGGGEEGFQRFDLFLEDLNVGQVIQSIGQVVVVELDLAQATAWVPG